jgi:hypothetical protein
MAWKREAAPSCLEIYDKENQFHMKAKSRLGQGLRQRAKNDAELLEHNLGSAE